MYDLDCVLSEIAEGASCIYSRYADDLVFSTRMPNSLERVLEKCRTAIQSSVSPRLRVNEKKVVNISKKRRVRITGLLISAQGRVSIGRPAKKKIKALMHQHRLAMLDAQRKSYLAGLLAYTKGVEPSFVDTLEAKYGVELVQSALRSPKVRRKLYDPEKLSELLWDPHRGER